MMIKIKYPHYPKDEKNKFEEDYKKIFNFSTHEWKKLKKELDSSSKKILNKYKINSFNDLIIAPFDVLLEIYNNFPEQKIKRNKSGKKIKSEYEILFEYEKLQPKISNFFMQYSEELKLKTCYFCNIDFINTVSFDVLDILKEGTKQELKELDGIGKDKANKIITHRKEKSINSIEDITKIKDIGIPKIGKNFDKLKNSIVQKNHFTLDHFLPKAKCPILALSLYNFVPSCYSCNSKFKKEEELLEVYLSPTSKDFSVEDDIKFKFYYEDEVSKNNLKLEMNYPKKIEKYVTTFKLKGRYNSHINEAQNIIEKKEKYSETRIAEIANILEISTKQVRNDIFGKELFEGDIQEKSFTKLKRDIYGEARLNITKEQNE